LGIVVRNRYNCVVCGKVFPEGQGILIKVDDLVVPLHSKRCAVKFLMKVIDELDPNKSKELLKRVKELFEEELKEGVKRRSKKI